MTRDEIAKEFDRFFEFDTADRSTVTSVSARLFAERIAAIVAAAEREACAKVCEEHWKCGGNSMECADEIETRGEPNAK